jgi:hypothetical protein
MISLKNNGAFVVKLEFEYYHETSSKWIRVAGTGDITLGFTKRANPGEHGVPDGSMVRLHANVIWGTDQVSNEMFLYEKGNTSMATYAISGTTLNNHLEYRGIESVLKKSDAMDIEQDTVHPDVMFDFSNLTDAEREEIKKNLENPTLAQGGTWGPISWDISFHFDPVDIKKSSADVIISVLGSKIISTHLDINNPKITVNTSIAGIDVVAEVGIDFNSRLIYLKGNLNYVFYSKSFDLTILKF